MDNIIIYNDSLLDKNQNSRIKTEGKI